MFLERLESGFLLFETKQGLVRVELSFQQRIYLLWAFRHFRQLSMPLLNSRQRALVSDLFLNNAGVVVYSDDSWPVIGMIENFVPPPEIDALPGQGALLHQESEPRQEAVLHRENEGRREEVALQPEGLLAQSGEIAPQPNSVLPSLPFGWSRLATIAGALSICVLSVAAWHRIQGMPGSQAHNQPQLQQINAISLPDVPRSVVPTVIADRPAPISPSTAIIEAPRAATTSLKPVSIAASVPKAKHTVRVKNKAPVSKDTLSGQESGIQVSRPPLHFVYPVYPNIRVRGGVALTAQVDSDGGVRAVRVISGNRALAAAAVRAVRQWHYRPYIKDGQAVATETNIVISFIAEDAISMTFPPTIPAAR